MKLETKDSIKGVLLVLLVAGSMVYFAYEFGTSLKRRAVAKEYNDSLKLENLKLEIEIKKRSLK